MDTTKVTVADKKTAEAFKLLGIDAIVKGEEGAAGAGASEDTALLKGQISDLEKSLGEKDLEIEALKKGVTDSGANPDTLTKAELSSKFEATALISKSVYEEVGKIGTVITDLVKSVTEKLEGIEEEVNKIGATSGQRKSATNTKFIEKAFTVDEKSGKKVLSKSEHGKAIADLLDSLSETSDNKEMYSDATVRFETSRQLTKSVALDLFENHDIQIID